MASRGSPMAIPGINGSSQKIPAELSRLEAAMTDEIPVSKLHSYLDFLSSKNISLDPNKNFVKIFFDLSQYNYTKMNDLGYSLPSSSWYPKKKKKKNFFLDGSIFSIIKQCSLSTSFLPSSRLCLIKLWSLIYCLMKNPSHCLIQFYLMYVWFTPLIKATIENNVIQKNAWFQVMKLRRLIQIKLDDSDKNQVIETFKKFTKLCTLVNDPSEAHGLNQRILFNSGILEDLFDYLDKFFDESKGNEAIIEQCLNLMRALGHQNLVFFLCSFLQPLINKSINKTNKTNK